jgi:magnesium and cobalt transporter
MTKRGDPDSPSGPEMENEDIRPPQLSAGQSIREWVRGLTRRNDEANHRENLAEMLGEEMEAAEQLAPVERLMLLNILRLGDTRVGDVMVPRADILGVDVSTSLVDLVKVLRDGFHSRVPLFQETLDDIVGFIHIKDVLEYWENETKFNLRSAAREILFVPQSMRVVDLLLKMRLTRVHMGIVVEIVGEIEDEHERVEGPQFTVRLDGAIIADGRAPIDELESRLGIDLVPDEREEDIDTVGGMLISLVGRVPLRGELIAHASGLEFEVLDSDPRRVKRVRIGGTPKQAGNSSPPLSSEPTSDK